MADPFLSPAIRSALRHINVSAAEQVSAEAFLAALKSPEAAPHSPAVAWLEEASPSQIAMMVATGVTSFTTLASIARQTLPVIHPTRRFLDEFAG
jgi:hypothetical protein